MSKFIIRGGKKLSGEVTVGGSKNAALPCIAAALLTSEPVLLRNVPRLTDVDRALEILESLGAAVSWEEEHAVRISCADVSLAKLDERTVSALRGSVLFMGPMLARFGAVTLPEPGGDIIGKRPLDAHFHAFTRLGATVERANGHVSLSAKGLRGAEVILPEFSVTATENALMAAARATGITTVKIAAAEPHVQNLSEMLTKMGAAVDGAGTHTVTVHGAATLHGCDHTIIPDMLEMGTFLVAAAATGGTVRIRGFDPSLLDIVMDFVERIGIKTEYADHVLTVHGATHIKPFTLKTLPYPGFASDLAPFFAVLATQAEGMSMIHERLYENRLGYVYWLSKMGANAVICDPHRVVFSGPTPLHGYEIKALDIRAGATLVIAGLTAEGETVVHDAEILDRGYEKLLERLVALGADIRREN